MILPQSPEEDHQLMVLVYGNDVSRTHWQESKPDYKLGRGFRSVRYAGKTDIEFELHCVSPGQYWVKAVWDKTPPHEYDLCLFDGSHGWRASQAADVTLSPGDCTNTQSGTVIVEAGEGSGSRHQGWEALRLGRPLFLMDSLVSSRVSWGEEMLSYGAQILTRDDIDFLFEFLPQGDRDQADAIAI